MQTSITREAAVRPTLPAGPAAAALLIGGALSLSAHVVMLQAWGVPFPDRSAVSAWAAFLNVVLAIFALSVFYDIAKPRLASTPAIIRWLIVAGVFAGLKELLRGGVMNGVVTTAWVFSFAHLIGPALYSLTLSFLLVFVVARLRHPWTKASALLAVAAVMTFAVKPLSALALSPLMHAVAGLDHAEIYPFPYGWHVLSWAYLTYLEPLAACVIAGALVLPGLAPRLPAKIAQFSLLIILIKGALLPTLLFGFYNPLGLGTGMLSESQFLFEALLLALPVALILPHVRPMRAARVAAV